LIASSAFNPKQSTADSWQLTQSSKLTTVESQHFENHAGISTLFSVTTYVIFLPKKTWPVIREYTIQTLLPLLMALKSLLQHSKEN